jgi:hypothetical protein
MSYQEWLGITVQNITLFLQSAPLQFAKKFFVASSASDAEHLRAFHRLNHPSHLVPRLWLVVNIAMIFLFRVRKQVRRQCPRQVAGDATLILNIEITFDV